MTKGLIAWIGFVLSTAGYAGEYSTYIGDSADYQVARIQTDSSGATYVAGSRAVGNTSREIFVMKLDAAGVVVAFNTMSGKGADTVNDLAVDAAGNFYVAGATSSVNLPLHNPFQSSPGPGFVAKFSSDAGQLIFSTYFPAAVRALAVDAAGNVYLTGSTNLPGFPVTPGLPAGKVTPVGTLASVAGAFLTKLSAGGDKVVYSTVLAGNAKNCGAGSSCFLSSRYTSGVSVAVDPAGDAYLAGNTEVSDLPTTSGALLTQGVGAFVAKVNASGTSLSYLTYIRATQFPISPSANAANLATAIAADAAGNAYVTGTTWDPNFPATKGAYQTTYTGDTTNPYSPPTDLFIAKINPAGSGVVWATYLGGKGSDVPNGISLDGAGNVWLDGTTQSVDFPNAQGWSKGADFLAELSANGATLPYSARYPNGAVSKTVAVDSAGTVHAAGPDGLLSAIMPGSPPLKRIFGIANAAYGNAGGRVAPGEVVSIYGPHIGSAGPVITSPDADGNLPTAAAGLQVIAGTQPLPLLYVSDSQINAVVPYYLGGASNIRVQDGGVSPEFPITLAQATPEIFQNADGTAVAVNQDGSFNSSDHPAPRGTVVSIWVTGVGSQTILGNAGQIASAAKDLYCCSVDMFGFDTNVTYAGASPGSVAGVIQVNFVAMFPGDYHGLAGISVTAGGASSHAAGIYVTP